MALDAAQIFRQSYATSPDAIRQMADIARAEARPAPQVERGVLMGTAVVVEQDPIAELMDSMEELSFSFEEKATKKLAERKMGPMQGSRTSFVKALEAWAAMMPDMPGRERVAHQARQLRQALADGGMSPESLLRNLGHESTDPTHQFAMLDLLEQMMGESETEARDLIQQARALLTRDKGAEIKAGINLAREVNARASTPEEMQGLRDLYRSEVIGFTRPQDCFRSLLAARGPGGLADAISFLIAGCGSDLASGNPSIGAAELGRILTDLGCVQALQTAMEKLDGLAARMVTQFGETFLLNGEQLTGRVVEMTEQPFVTAATVARLVGECGVAKLLAQMDFSRELTRLFRQLSPRLFASEDDRIRLVDAAQEHLDGLVARENDEEEGEEGIA